MAEACSDDDENLWERELEKNRDEFMKRLRPVRFVAWLRSAEVMDLSDEETIMHQVTTLEKCGSLLDIVKRRGKPGYDALMELTQYECPYLYKKITGKEPQKPNDDYSKRIDSYVFSSSYRAGANINEFCKKLLEENEELRELAAGRDELENHYKELQTQLLSVQAYCIDMQKEKDAIQEMCYELMYGREQEQEQEKFIELEKKASTTAAELHQKRKRCSLERNKSVKLRENVDKVSEEKMRKIDSPERKEMLKNHRGQVIVENYEDWLRTSQADTQKELQDMNKDLEKQNEKLRLEIKHLQSKNEDLAGNVQRMKAQTEKVAEINDMLYQQVSMLTNQKKELEEEKARLWITQDRLLMQLQRLSQSVDILILEGTAEGTPK